MFLLLVLTYFVFVSGEYRVKEGAVPSYLYHKFNDVKEEVFPHDIHIKVSLSRVAGTLLYSVDRRMNQLIVSLNDADVPMLKIEFNKQESYVSLPQICRCERCRFELLILRIQMRDDIHLQCNGGEIMILGINERREVNRDYPIPYKEDGAIPDSSNEAHMWLVNTPQYGDVYPSGVQLSGCILDVCYNDIPIIFSNISDNIGRNCNKTCTRDICNGGQCYETYNAKPLCNCTNTFMNGDYCNRTISPWNARSLSQYFMFNILKLSFMSSVNTILELKSTKTKILLTRSGRVVSLNYKYNNGLNITVGRNLTESYVLNGETILIIQFSNNAIITEFFNNGSWHFDMTPTFVDLRLEIFDHLSLRSGRGILELVHKDSPRQHKWRKVVISNQKEILPEDDVAASHNVTLEDGHSKIAKAQMDKQVLRKQKRLSTKVEKNVPKQLSKVDINKAKVVFIDLTQDKNNDKMKDERAEKISRDKLSLMNWRCAEKNLPN